MLVSLQVGLSPEDQEDEDDRPDAERVEMANRAMGAVHGTVASST